jgi:hypothetical protein
VNLTADLTGPYAHSFEGYTPSKRFGATPWTNVLVQEAPLRTGPWVQYAHGTLTPADTNPAAPAARSFTAPGATLASAWNRVVFTDAAGNQEPFRPVFVGTTWRPTVQDIADLSPAYTNQAGAFDQDTTPDASQVEAFIRIAMTEVAGRAGVSAERLEQVSELALAAAMWHAAASVEAQKSPEGTDRSEAGYSWKQSSYVACLNELLTQARRAPLRLT